MATIAKPLKPWIAPNFAVDVDGLSYRLADMPSDAVDDMVARWISDVYAKAGRPSPWAYDLGRVQMMPKPLAPREGHPEANAAFPMHREQTKDGT